MRCKKEEDKGGTDGKQEEGMKGRRNTVERNATGKVVEKKEKLRVREEAFIWHWLALGNECTMAS